VSDVPVRKPGFITFGIDASVPSPMEIGDPLSADFDGYEVDLMRGVAARLGVQPRYRAAVWSKILEELEAGEIDAICTAATVTPDRAARFDLSRPYLEIELVLVVRDGVEVAVPADARGKRFGLRSATVAERYARERLAPGSVVETEYNEEMYAELARGGTDVVVDDSPIAAHFARTLPGLRVAARLPDTRSHYAMMVAKRSALREVVDVALEGLESDGSAPASRRKWFGDSSLSV
jgi:L-cystine transport system substrate-binding protein